MAQSIKLNNSLFWDSAQAIHTAIGSWTPTIPRATLTNISGKYIQIGKLLIATATCNVTASETSNAYIDWSSLPVIVSTRPIWGQWQCSAGTAGELGEDGNNNNNCWFSKGGTRIPLTSLVGYKLSFCVMYTTD